MEERIKQLEKVTERLMRRTRKAAIGLITPYPISNAVFGDRVEGPILRYMFPCDGRVTKGMLSFSSKPKNPVNVDIKIFNDSTSAVKGFVIDKKTISVVPNLDVKAGDCLEVSLSTLPDDIVTGVWISFLWIPTVKDVEAKSFLIAELESDVEAMRLEIGGPAL